MHISTLSHLNGEAKASIPKKKFLWHIGIKDDIKNRKSVTERCVENTTSLRWSIFNYAILKITLLKILHGKNVNLRRERNAYRKQLLFILRQWGSGNLSYDDCQDALSTIIKFKR
jgi:hypothetical protein